MLTNEQAITLLTLEVKPALGCTEPVCVALCAADAAKAAGGLPEKLEILVCPSIYKNAKAVAIPNFPLTGLEYAAALGAFIARPELGLELFSAITPEIAVAAKQFVDGGKTQVTVEQQEKEIFVQANVLGNDAGESVIRGGHANIVRTRRNGTDLFRGKEAAGGHESLIESLAKMRICEIRKLVESMDAGTLTFMLDGRDMNESLAELGLNDTAAFGLARIYDQLPDVMGNGLMRRIVQCTVACAECRMTGVPRSVMSSAGSGNHGITAIIPVCELAAYLKKDEETLCRALAISHLINIYIKHYSGKLSPLCGCGISAATAASAAMVWLLGGDDQAMAGAISNMAGSITGMLCDGAKVGCAIKLGTAVETAVTCTCLAMKGVALPAGNGIVAGTPEDTIKNIGRISLEGMRTTDDTILDIMAQGSRSC